eukprot:12906200-Prorocentrum_lima.AAC.1
METDTSLTTPKKVSGGQTQSLLKHQKDHIQASVADARVSDARGMAGNMISHWSILRQEGC